MGGLGNEILVKYKRIKRKSGGIRRKDRLLGWKKKWFWYPSFLIYGLSYNNNVYKWE